MGCYLTGCSSAKTEEIKTPEVSGEEKGTFMVPVFLEGGSGRASVSSPAEITYEDGEYTARIVWSSPNYDYLIIGDETYYPINDDGNSEFQIPVHFVDGENFSVDLQADTTAMGTPHLINYTLFFGEDAGGIAYTEEDAAQKDEAKKTDTAGAVEAAGLTITGSMELRYADQFSIDYCEDGSRLLTTSDGDRFLLLKKGLERPEGLDPSIASISLPAENLYVASSSAVDLFREIGAIDCVKLTSTNAASWSIQEIADLVENKTIGYAGKYSSPDYEALIRDKIGFTVENTMIYHTPEVKEMIMQLGIPVLVERSSYESHPLGRLEWVLLYGILTGHEEEAAEFFDRSCRLAEAAADQGALGKSAALFSVSTGGYAVVRSPEDYLAKMIGLAGGEYVPADLKSPETSVSTINLQMEAFFQAVSDADFLIYNGTIEGTLETVDELVGKASVLAGCRAVREGNVWCTEKNLYQETTGIPKMIEELRLILSGTADTEQLTYFHKLQ